MKRGCVDDLATLSELNEEIILQELQARYEKDVIYVSEISSWWTKNEQILIQICLHLVCFLIDLVIN